MVDDDRDAARELEAAGLYDPEAGDARERFEALRLLMEHGATVDDLVATRNDSEAWPRDVLRPGARLSWREVAERAAVPLEMDTRIRRAAGFPDSDPDTRAAGDADVALMQGFAASAEMFDEDMTLQLTRVIGSAAARIADALVSAFVVNIGPAAMADDPSGLELVRANLDAVNLLPLVNAAIDIMLRAHMVALQRPLAGLGVEEGGVETQRLAVGFRRPRRVDRPRPSAHHQGARHRPHRVRGDGCQLRRRPRRSCREADRRRDHVRRG